MKRLTPLLLALPLCGCSGPERITPAEFEKQYAEVGMPQSMHRVTYLGRRGGRVYLKRSSMSTASKKWSDQVLYVKLSELDATFRDSRPKTAMKETP